MGLVKAYEVAFKKFNILTAQMLLTHEDLGKQRKIFKC
jgi:glutamate 5-kinase